MTDNEIIKALNVCCEYSDCDGCPYGYIRMESGLCLYTMQTDALKLIIRQREEIERLQKHNTVVAEKHFKDGIKYLAAEIYKKIGSEKNKHYKVISECVERFGVNRYEDCFCAVCDGKILALDDLRFFIEDFVKKEVEEK